MCVISIFLYHSLGDRRGTTWSGNQHSPFLSFVCSPHGRRSVPNPSNPGLTPSMCYNACYNVRTLLTFNIDNRVSITSPGSNIQTWAIFRMIFIDEQHRDQLFWNFKDSNISAVSSANKVSTLGECGAACEVWNATGKQDDGDYDNKNNVDDVNSWQ